MLIQNIYNRGFSLFILRGVLLVIIIHFSSCKKFLEVDLNKSQIISDDVFDNDADATAAIIGIYQQMEVGHFAGGGDNGIPAFTGLSSDEFHNILQTTQTPNYVSFEQNQIQPDNPAVLNLWTQAYQIIYQANDILEELSHASGVTTTIKNQLRGESLFIRSYCFFYLANLFGECPLTLTTDYRENAKISRAPVSNIYDQIIADLKESGQLLGENYPMMERARVNKLTAAALIARVYLYTEQWSKAMEAASSVIDNDLYSLSTDLDQVFLKESTEVIWQLASGSQGFIKNSYAYFIFEGGFSDAISQITPSLLGSFETGDQRKNKWVGIYHNNETNVDISFPYKYKHLPNSPITEHFVILRLAEMYLIRAESKARENDLEGAIQDLDEIRNRAGLPLIHNTNPSISTEDLIDTIIHERQIELFNEQGHRWFDLKRLGLATSILQPIKTQWQETDVLYPVPQNEFNKNPSLGDQNLGY